jgi:iron only hydrogenase large subunit-like protein
MSTYLSRVASAAAFALFTMICSSAFAQRPFDPNPSNLSLMPCMRKKDEV